MASHAQNSSSHRSGQRSRANQCYAYDAASVNAVRLIKSRNDVAFNYLLLLLVTARLVPACSIFRGICARIFACCDTLFALSQFSISFVRFTLDEVCMQGRELGKLRHSGLE